MLEAARLQQKVHHQNILRVFGIAEFAEEGCVPAILLERAEHDVADLFCEEVRPPIPWPCAISLTRGQAISGYDSVTGRQYGPWGRHPKHTHSTLLSCTCAALTSDGYNLAPLGGSGSRGPGGGGGIFCDWSQKTTGS